MNLNNFTIKSQEVIQQAQNMAMQQGHQSVETGHILLSMMDADENVVPFILKKINVNTQAFDDRLDKIVEQYPKVSGGSQYLSNDAVKAVQKANSYLKEFKDEFVTLEHLFLGILSVSDKTDQLLL